MFLLRKFSYAKAIKTPVNLPSYGNAEIGKKLANGAYIFSGVKFNLDIDNPWLIDPPSPEVEQYLHGFCWLNELAAYGNSQARKVALEWIQKWHFYNLSSKKTGWNPEIIALRSTNLLRNWGFLTERLNLNFDHTLISLWRDYRYLQILIVTVKTGLKKVKIIYSVFILALAYDDSFRKQKKILKKLCKVLQSCIETNGQITSRNPEDFLQYFLVVNDVLTFQKKNKLLTKKDLNSLENLKKTMVPILRGLRLGNGWLTRSHGGDSGSIDVLDKYLMSSNVNTPPALTGLLGFERIVAGRLVLIVDCGKPDFSIDANNPHASCLSFELSSGQRPIFVNCGPGGRFGSAYKRYCRSTRAHNTCTLENISQLNFEFISRKKRWPKEIISSGPRNINIDRQKTLEATWLSLSQDCYESEYGYTHHRKLFVLNSGKAFTGIDIFEITKLNKSQIKGVENFYAYFQLHPDVELWDHPRLQTIILRLKNGEHWIFEVDLGQVNIEESTFINSLMSQPEHTKRIVIKSSTLLKKTEIKWSLRRREIVSRNTRDSDIVY